MDKWPRPEVIITHESDLDGFVSGMLLQGLARHWYDQVVPLEAYQNDIWQKRALVESSAWVSDFSFDPRMDRVNWVVVDHHPLNSKPKFATLVHDTGECSCSLVYQACRSAGLRSDKLDRLVPFCRLADLFLQEHPDFEQANDYANLVKNYQFWNLHALIEGDPERLWDHPLLQVMAVKRRVEDPLGLAWSRSRIVALSSTVGYVDTVVGNTNMIVNRLLQERASPYTVLLSMFRKGNGTVVASLRSLNGEALEVAEILHGGGHPNACGAVLPRSVQSIPDAILYLQKVLNPAPERPNSSLNDLEGVLDGL